jgi:hypothetical protein
VTQNLDIFTNYPVLETPEPDNSFTIPDVSSVSIDEAPALDWSRLNLTDLLPLWLTSPTLLEALPAVPVRAADNFGSAIVRVLRAQTGFSAEGPGVAGMDEVHRTDDGQAIGLVELGLHMYRRRGLQAPSNLEEAVALGDDELVSFSRWMIWMGMRWLTRRDLLVGMAWAFMEMHEALAKCQEDVALLDKEDRCTLQEIAIRERKGLCVCREEMLQDQKRKEDFYTGLGIARRAIEKCFTR